MAAGQQGTPSTRVAAGVTAGVAAGAGAGDLAPGSGLVLVGHAVRDQVNGGVVLVAK